MGLDPERLRFLQRAAEAGLGAWRMDEIGIDGNLVPLENFKLPPLGGEAILDNAAVQAMLESKIRLTPQAAPDGCTACGACVEQCPAQALSMVDDLPQVDMAKCVTCFCCQEICPEKAMVLQ
jgi:ferredoxin